MNKMFAKARNRLSCLAALTWLAAHVHIPWVYAQDQTHLYTENTFEIEQSIQTPNDTYILGPGDRLQIELIDIPELSGLFSVGPDGTLYLPRLRALYVEGLTIEELRMLLTEQFLKYAYKPEVYIRAVNYRPIRVYVGGEVKRPGYYTLTGVQGNSDDLVRNSSILNDRVDSDSAGFSENFSQETSLAGGSSSATLFPTVFDAIRIAQGITPYSDLSQVQVTRRQAMSKGSGRLRARLNFISLITEGDESQNIRLFDGDFVNVGKSPTVLRDQLLKAGQSNLTPAFMEVFVTGRVERAGPITLPQGSSLIQAVDLAGGTKVLHGKVEFIRFTREGQIDRRIFGFQQNAPSGDYRNPILMPGDVIRLRETMLTKSLSVINEITSPAIGVYSIYSLFSN